MAEPKRYFINNLPCDGSLDLSLQKQRVEAFMASIRDNLRPSSQGAEDGGLYVGGAGISYMFYHISKLAPFEESRPLYLRYAKEYLQLPLTCAIRTRQSGHITEKTGFLTGNIGIFALAAVIFKRLNDEDKSTQYLNYFKDVYELLLPLNWFKNGGDELFVGRTGYLCALLWLRKELGIEVICDSKTFKLLDTIIESGKSYSTAIKSPIPLMYHYYGTQYLGAAHGLAGILFVLLQFPSWLEGRPEFRNLIKSSIDILLQLQTPSGNFPSAMDEISGQRRPEDDLVHWCHGAPGTIYLLSQAFKVFQEEKYLTAAIKCGDVTWHKGLLKKGPGICHGVAGSGYVFLMLYKVTKNAAYKQKALQFMNFIYSEGFRRAKTPDCPFSLYEGTAGTACFAADLCCPEAAQFPFFNI